MKTRKPADIFQAIADKDILLIRALVDSGADLSVTNAEGLKPIQAAGDSGYWEAVRVFARRKKDKEDLFHFGAVLLTAVEEDRLEETKILLKAKARTSWRRVGAHNYPIHFAVLNKNVTIVDLLLKHHADITDKNAESQTPLQIACSLGCWRILRHFLKYIQAYKDNANGIHAQSELVDMNALFVKDSLSVSMAWRLAWKEKWELLWGFAKLFPIDLSVRRTFGMASSPNVAELLVKNQKWELLYHILVNDHLSHRKHFKNMLLIPFEGGPTLIDYWIKSDHVSSERFLTRCKQKFLLNLRMTVSADTPLYAKLSFVYVKRLEQEAHQHLVNDDLSEAKNNLHELFTALLTIPDKSVDYPKAQAEIANVIHNQILPFKNLHDWAVDFLKSRLRLITTFYDSSTNELKLRMIMMECAAKGGDGWLAANLYAEVLKQNADLRNENEKLKQKKSNPDKHRLFSPQQKQSEPRPLGSVTRENVAAAADRRQQ